MSLCFRCGQDVWRQLDECPFCGKEFESEPTGWLRRLWEWLWR